MVDGKIYNIMCVCLLVRGREVHLCVFIEKDGEEKTGSRKEESRRMTGKIWTAGTGTMTRYYLVIHWCTTKLRLTMDYI